MQAEKISGARQNKNTQILMSAQLKDNIRQLKLLEQLEHSPAS